MTTKTYFEPEVIVPGPEPLKLIFNGIAAYARREAKKIVNTIDVEFIKEETCDDMPSSTLNITEVANHN